MVLLSVLVDESLDIQQMVVALRYVGKKGAIEHMLGFRHVISTTAQHLKMNPMSNHVHKD